MKAANGRLTTRQEAGKYAAVRTAAPIFFLFFLQGDSRHPAVEAGCDLRNSWRHSGTPEKPVIHP
jgi:hypothetical protein